MHPLNLLFELFNFSIHVFVSFFQCASCLSWHDIGATYNGYVYGPTVLRILELTQPQPPTDAEIAANPQLKRNDTTGWTTAVRPWQVHGVHGVHVLHLVVRVHVNYACVRCACML